MCGYPQWNYRNVLISRTEYVCHHMGAFTYTRYIYSKLTLTTSWLYNTLSATSSYYCHILRYARSSQCQIQAHLLISFSPLLTKWNHSLQALLDLN